jgi:hypothetical protein
MADDPDSMVLRLLRDIRSKIEKLDDHDKRFDKIEKKLDLTHFQLTHSLGLSGMANLQSQHTSERVESLEERQKRFEDGMAEIQRRVKEMAAKIDA